ncbi:MAG: LPS-assembly protein LptD, partial [Bacteroidetes bacterium]|nr:LPS-assembly protein LptD [Bacteroidota bacterium]
MCAQKTDSTSSVESSIAPKTDSFKTDTSRINVSLPISKSALKEEVKCSARDSIVYDILNKMVLLYGAVVIDYGDLHLESEIVYFDYSKNTIKALGKKDSLGNKIGYPKIVDKGREFAGDSMLYNVESSKGKIYNLKLQEGNGYIHVDQSKKMPDDVLYAQDAKYSTCDADQPHFWMHMSKAKIIPNDKVVTGPAYLMIEDVPFYFAALPFGYFPTNFQKAKSGILFPKYGFTPRKGYNLSEGGYYFAISDQFDLAVTGDVFSFGYWGVDVRPRYNVRY